jgi:hypothetical protein
MKSSKKSNRKSENKSLERKRTISYSVIFIAISFLIMSVLGIIFLVQMDLQPGWEFNELQGKRPVKLSVIEDSGSNRIFCSTDFQGYGVYESTNPDPNWGGIYLLNPKTGSLMEQRTLDGPIKDASQVMDVDKDGIKDYLISKATTGEWSKEAADSDGYNLEIIEHGFTNKIISGKNLSDIEDTKLSSSIWIFDAVSGEEIVDGKSGFICLEKRNISRYEYSDFYEFYLTSYYENGTIVRNYTLNPGLELYHSEDGLPKIELFNYNGNNHLLFGNSTYFALYNLSTPNFVANPIYNYTSPGHEYERFENFEIITDLDSDGIGEIVLINQTSNITAQILAINGISGKQIHRFDVSFEFEFFNAKITEINNTITGLTYLGLSFNGDTDLNGDYYHYLNITIYEITQTEVHQKYTNLISGTGGGKSESIGVLGDDLNEDGISEIIEYYRTSSSTQTMETFQMLIFGFIGEEIRITLDLNFYISELQSVADFDGDGIRDILIAQDESLTSISSREPLPIFLSTAFPLGYPIFFVLIAFLVISIILLFFYGRTFKFATEPIKEKIRGGIKKKKLTIGTIVISVFLITITFVMFLSLINVMNSTLIAGTWISNVTIINLLVMILWYALLPLTAALYNLFAPYFAYFFIRLRSLFFRISNAYDDKILVLDMKGREELGLVSKLKRIIVPLSLSLAFGFFIYNTFAPLMGYRTTFTNISGESLGKFMGGYMLLCILPLVSSFTLFGFFNAGNYLLDDSGVVYLREPKNYRKPADVEPISYWTQSIVKGFAGLSAVLTFFQFVLGLDISKVVDMAGIGAFFLTFLLIIIFYVLPFLTGFSYLLLAEELMDFSTDYNRDRLYRLMNKKYDTNLREIKVPKLRSQESPK